MSRWVSRTAYPSPLWSTIWSIRCRRARPAITTFSISASTPRRWRLSRNRERGRNDICNPRGREVGKERKRGRRDDLAPVLVILGIKTASVQLLPDFRNALAQEVVGDLTLHRL